MDSVGYFQIVCKIEENSPSSLCSLGNPSAIEWKWLWRFYVQICGLHLQRQADNLYTGEWRLWAAPDFFAQIKVPGNLRSSLYLCLEQRLMFHTSLCVWCMVAGVGTSKWPQQSRAIFSILTSGICFLGESVRFLIAASGFVVSGLCIFWRNGFHPLNG